MLPHAARHHLLILLIGHALLAACAAQVGTPGTGGGPAGEIGPVAAPTVAISGAPRSGAAERAALVAVDQVGIPYRYGGDTRGGFDCSGLVHYAYGRAGIDTPRSTGALWRQLTPVPGRELRIGDVLFFDIAGKVAHVGLYLGDGRFVHAPSSGRHVAIDSLDSGYYRQAFVRGGRPE